MNIKQCTNWCIGATITLVPVASLALPVDIIEAYFEFRNMYESLSTFIDCLGVKQKIHQGKVVKELNHVLCPL